MHAHLLELGRLLLEELRLPDLAAEGLKSHELDAGRGRVGDDREHQSAGDGLKQREVMDWLETAEARVLLDDVGVEIAHGAVSFA
jgi:hypothetical protein